MGDFTELINAVNGVAVLIFLVLLGAVIVSMSRRVILYRRAGLPMPVILKRGWLLFGAMGLLASESVVLRVLGGDLFTGPTLLRLAFIIQFDVIFLTALAYYTKTELFDVDDEDTP